MSFGLRKLSTRGLPGLLAGAFLAHAGPLVMVLSDTGGNAWRGATVQRQVSPDFLVEQTFERQDGLARIVVVRSAHAAGAANQRTDFAQALKQQFATGAGPASFDAPVHRLGRAGREMHFTFVHGQRSYACELFVFADQAVNWGILCARAIGHPDTPSSLLDLLYEKSAAPPEVAELAPYAVRGDATSSFPISLRFLGDPASHRVTHIFVTQTALPANDGFKGSFDADHVQESPIEVGDEIVAIDGRPSPEFDYALGRDTELGRIFLNRQRGDEVKLELISARTHRRFETTLRASPFQWRPRP